MTLSPSPFCSYCDVKSSDAKLLLCQDCRVVHYCGRDHQVAHRENHQKVCRAIRRTKRVIDKEETKLRHNPGDMFTPPNLFEEQVGRFWGILDTRNYMRARYDLMDALLKVNTYAAAEAAHGHLMDMLRLNRSDNMGVRDLVPALKLRLGRDQECYDFCKWWATTGELSNYDWGDMSNPYLDIKDADVFESPRRIFTKKFGCLSHTIAITLLKIRLLMDLRALQNSSVIIDKVPQEILDTVWGELVSGSVVAENKSIMNANDQTLLIENLETQFRDLYKAVRIINGHFWPALLDPGEHLTARPEEYSPGSLQEMQLVLQYNFDAWTETSGAIEMIRELSGVGGH